MFKKIKKISKQFQNSLYHNYLLTKPITVGKWQLLFLRYTRFSAGTVDTTAWGSRRPIREEQEVTEQQSSPDLRWCGIWPGCALHGTGQCARIWASSPPEPRPDRTSHYPCCPLPGDREAQYRMLSLKHIHRQWHFNDRDQRCKIYTQLLKSVKS